MNRQGRRFMFLTILFIGLSLNLPTSYVFALNVRQGAYLKSSVQSRSLQANKLKIRLNKLKPGDTIVTGRKVIGGCEYPAMDLIIEKFEKKSEWAAYRADDECNLVLEFLWKGTVDDAPEPIRELLARAEPDGIRVPAKEQIDTTVGDFAYTKRNAVMYQSSCETHKNFVMTYGGGGTADKLTELVGWINACKNSNGSFTSGSTAGSCWVATWPPSWDWVTDGCSYYDLEVQSNTVAGKQKGTYHCSPRNVAPCNASDPDGYDHNLYLSQRVYFGGSTYCTRSVDRKYVFGPWSYNLQGCG